MAAPNTTKAILNWMCATRFEDIHPDVRQLAVFALYDGIGGILACSMLPVAHRMVDFVNLVGGPPDCTMIGFPARTSVLNAALLNGTLGYGDEMDAHDGDGRGNHILAANMGAALTMGQLVGAPGQEVLRGVVLGYELSKRIVRVAAQVDRETGIASGPVDAGSSIGATAAAGIVLGLPPDRLEVALGLAAHMSCSFFVDPSDADHMAASYSRGGGGARNGVTAALMAKAGYNAPLDILDGPRGFFHSRLGREDPGPEFLRGLGEEYGITGLIFKRHNAGGTTHVARLVLLEIMSENNLSAGDIAEIRAEIRSGRSPARHAKIAETQAEVAPKRNNGTTIRELRDDRSYYRRNMLALAAVYRAVGFREAYDEQYYKSPEVSAMRERVKFFTRDDWAGNEDRFYAGVTVITQDGRNLRKESADRQMTEEELDAKFSHLVGLRAGDAKAKELAQVLKRLDTVSNVAEVMEQLELPEAHIGQV